MTLTYKHILAALIVLVIIWFAALGLCSIIFHVYERTHQPSRIASPKIKARMAYHGPPWAECDHNGKCKFLNEKGQWCKL